MGHRGHGEILNLKECITDSRHKLETAERDR